MDRRFKSRAWRKGAAALGLALVVSAGSAGAEEEVPPARCAAPGWQRYEVEHRGGFGKTVTFEDPRTGEARTLKFKGIPWSRDSAWNLLVDREVYGKGVHRVRYRFTHPWTGRPLELRARAISHRVGGVPIRSEDSEPQIQLFDDGEREPRGRLSFAWEGAVLFAGELDGRRVEIERTSLPPRAERGLLKVLIFPFPLEGDFVVRIDGCFVARFNQGRQHGTRVPYELTLAAAGDAAPREDAVLAFLVFDLMREFIEGAVG